MQHHNVLRQRYPIGYAILVLGLDDPIVYTPEKIQRFAEIEVDWTNAKLIADETTAQAITLQIPKVTNVEYNTSYEGFGIIIPRVEGHSERFPLDILYTVDLWTEVLASEEEALVCVIGFARRPPEEWREGFKLGN